ncbi:MAG: aspartate/glutamate racemase family protein [Methanoregula sp.]|jgi:aspartate racemase
MKREISLIIVFSLLVMLLAASGCTATQPAGQKETGTVTPVPTATFLSPAPGEMKTIGIIGGVSWASTVDYYRYMNEKVQNDLGGDNSAKIVMYSIEFGEFSRQERLADAGNWDPLNATMLDAARRVKAGGADFIVIGSNTLNSRAEDIEAKVGIPVLRIYDATGAKVNKSGLKKVALLGTKFTMEQPFYRDALANKYGIQVVTPNATERDFINTVIFDELCRNDIRNESRAEYVRIINRLVDEEGAQGVILGCTEIPLLVHQGDVNVPVFDTTRIHAEAAVDYALNRT